MAPGAPVLSDPETVLRGGLAASPGYLGAAPARSVTIAEEADARRRPVAADPAATPRA
ncbi:MAG TPA: hypothetical protein VGO95_02475 [Modestobacter sp.]|nr:hypothetical protein [Modestobacter sp.]